MSVPKIGAFITKCTIGSNIRTQQPH